LTGSSLVRVSQGGGDLPAVERDLGKYNSAVLQLHSCSSFSGFDQAIMHGLRQLAPYEGGCIFSLDPVTQAVNEVYLADVPQAAYDQYAANHMENDWLRHEALSCPLSQPRVTRVTDFRDRREWDRTSYARFMLSYNLYYLASIDLAYNGRYAKRINILRSPWQADFSNSELSLLQLFALQIEATNNRLMAEEIYNGDGVMSYPVARGICVFSEQAECLYINDFTRRVFQRQEAGLYQKIQDTCAHLIRLAESQGKRLFNYNGFLTLHRAKLKFNFFACREREERRFFVLAFDYLEETADRLEWAAAFTSREQEILKLLIQGKTNREIGTMLAIAPDAVKTHIRNLLGKTGTASRTALAAKALRILLADVD
jgi:DNA-binding CsgD family transcriptional regulator